MPPVKRKFQGKDVRVLKRRRIVTPATVPGLTRSVGYYGRYNKGCCGSNESKFFDSDWGQIGVALTGNRGISSFCLIAAGVKENERVGRKITVQSLTLHWQIRKPVTINTADASSVCRILVVVDRQCNGAVATPQDVWQPQQGTAAVSYLSFNNLVNKNRFRTLMDKSVKLEGQPTGFGSVANPDTAESSYYGNAHFKMNMPISYSGTTGAITEIATNNITVFMISDTANNLSVLGSARVRYLD